jgi:hypothetical protein
MHAPSLACTGPAFDCFGVVRSLTRWFLVSYVLVVAVCGFSFSEESTPEKNVLALYSFSARESFVQLEPL